jgi:PD-(D/E)XK nuclease superfamily protein
MQGDTRTGAVLEAMVLPALKRGGYTYQIQAKIGERLGCGAHKVDVLAEKDERRLLISLKWQQASGTIEQKVPFETICLAEALDRGYDKAYVVLGGEGMRAKLRQFYVSGGLKPYLNVPWDRIDIVTLEGFIAKANQGKL